MGGEINSLLGFEGVKEARSPGNVRKSYLLSWALIEVS
jgi:hypothetical protein